MSDIFAITVPLPSGTYPSVNHLGKDGFRGGRKSEQYHALFDAVVKAAREEMARTGWQTATWYCEYLWTRYHRTRRKHDSSNGNKVEADALQAAGVVIDDEFLRPMRLHSEYDPDGQERVSIVLMRRYPPMLADETIRRKSETKAVKAAPKAAKAASKTPKAATGVRKMPPALVAGKAVPYEEGRRLLMNSLGGH